MENKQNIEKRLYELLPDYIFDKLDGDEKNFFEQNYKSFSNIENEVIEGKKFFARLDAMDFDKIFGAQTKNVSARVHNKRAKKSKNSSFWSVYRFVLPTMALAAVLIILWKLMFAPSDRIIHIDQEQLALLEKPIFTDEELAQDIELNYVDMNVVLSHTIYSNSYSFSYMYDLIGDAFADEYNETLELAYLESPEFFWGFGSQNNISIINEINNLPENDFYKLLEELSRDEIFSY